jgi:hypothetical protein
MRQWGTGGRFVVPAIVSGLILMSVWPAPRDPIPAPWVSAMLIAGLLTLIIALVYLARLLGASSHSGAGMVFWTFALEAVIAARLAISFNSGIGTLIAGLALSVSFLGLIYWVFSPHGVSTFRAIAVVESVVLAAASLRIRATRRRHSVQLVNAAGLLALVLGLTFVALAGLTVATTSQFGTSGPLLGPAAPGFGWKLYVVLAGAALVAFAIREREAGPAIIGTFVLYAFALMAGISGFGHGSIVGWPLVLLIVGGAAFAFALAPRGGLPAPPGAPPAGAVPPPPSSPPTPPPPA